MNKTAILLLKIACGIVLSCFALILGATLLVNQNSFQNKVLKLATDMMEEELQTHVAIDRIDISLFNGNIGLYGVDIEDQQQRKMFTMKRLDTSVALLPLLNKRIVIDKLEIEELNALLIKEPGQEANYQFIIDAFKKDKTEQKAQKAKEPKTQEMEFDISGVKLNDIKVTYNKAVFALTAAEVGKGKDGMQVVKISKISGGGQLPSKTGDKEFQVRLDGLVASIALLKKGEKGRLPGIPVDVSSIQLNDVTASYGNQSFHLGSIDYKGSDMAHDVIIDDVKTKFTSKSKKGDVDNTVDLYRLTAHYSDKSKTIDIDSLRFKTDNGQPRKNTGKPNGGFFDTGHLDVVAHMNWDINYIGKDTLNATLKHATLNDSITGIDIRELKMQVAANKRRIHLSEVMVKQPATVLNIDSAQFTLPNKKEGIPLSYSTSQIAGTVVLKDISRPFAPVLKGFTIPLHLSTRMSGTDDSMSFKDVRVHTTDKRLTIYADGGITDLKDKLKMEVRFNVSQMKAIGDIKEKIINQFTVKKLMMKQLKLLGDITFQGDFGVLWKKEEFRGNLGSAGGKLNLYFALDENNKYVNGRVHTTNFQLGKIMDMSSIGGVDCDADFKIDISKPRTAQMRKKKGGKLPIGEVKAKVQDCSFKGIHVRNISVNIISDGALATGDLLQHGNHRDLSCKFSFTNTDEMQKMKITDPGIKFHKMSAEDKEAKAARKLQKQQEKAARKKEKEKKAKEDAAKGKKKKKFLFF